jgi:hypothetical protein
MTRQNANSAYAFKTGCPAYFSIFLPFFDAHEMALRDKLPKLLTRSPKGSVPILRLPDGQVLEQMIFGFPMLVSSRSLWKG